MNEKFKSLRVAVADKRRQLLLALAIGDSVSADTLKDELEKLQGEALSLVQHQ